MVVRKAHYDDIPQVSGLLSDFYAESEYNAPLVDPEKTAWVLRAYIDAPEHKKFFEVVDDDGTVVGFMIGERQDDLWSHAIRTIEVGLYVKPHYRGRPSAGRLMLNFADWAQQWSDTPNMIRVEASSGLTDTNAAQVYAKLGYLPRGSLHGVEV